MSGTPQLEVVSHKVDEVRERIGALDNRLAREHRENREALSETAKRLAETDAKLVEKLDDIAARLDTVREVGWRHDEQIKTIQRGGGSALALAITLICGLLLDWLRRMGGGH